MLSRMLAHPATRQLNIDDPQMTEVRREIVRSKRFLRLIYEEWYGELQRHLPAVAGPVLEIGSGAGFLAEVIPGLVTSEVFPCRGIDVAFDARQLPFGDSVLRAIVMTDVFHHIPDVRLFLLEAQRTLQVGGRVLMVEPWKNAWSTLIYGKLHHEPFRPEATEWSFPASGPLSGANGALPWIVFERDSEELRNLVPGLALKSIRPFMPLRYLLSGGVSLRSLMPGWLHSAWRFIETAVPAIDRNLGMFAFIELERESLEHAAAAHRN